MQPLILPIVILLISSVSAITCPIFATRTTQQFNLTQCSFEVTRTSLTLNMTYKTINDVRGAIANEVDHFTGQSANPYVYRSYVQKLQGDVNHHNGQEIVSRFYLTFNETTFPKDGDYFLTNSLCYYHCEGHAYPVCQCDEKFWTKIPFKVEREQLRIE